MGEKNDYITWKVVWSYLLLLLTAVCSVWYIYTILQQLAVDDPPETSNREKIYLVTNTLSLIYESEALGQLVGMPNKDYRNFNRTIKQAHRNLDSLRFIDRLYATTQIGYHSGFVEAETLEHVEADRDIG
ncbi:MAG: hypothetical protein L6V92_03555 [Phocaeicola vulgatus]|nr:MAG: hypothetical protein L6V92_03555 [Phocaeicola vulgatus]